MATKKTATKKSSTKKSSTQRPSAQKSGTQKASTQESNPPKSSSGRSGSRRPSSAPRAAAPRRMPATEVASAAARQLLELTGQEAEGVTGLERTDEGWSVEVEVVEVRRIPDTTDVLALYQVEVDERGDLVGYRRLRRYARGVPGEG